MLKQRFRKEHGNELVKWCPFSQMCQGNYRIYTKIVNTSERMHACICMLRTGYKNGVNHTSSHTFEGVNHTLLAPLVGRTKECPLQLFNHFKLFTGSLF